MATVSLDDRKTAMLDAIQGATGAKHRPDTIEMLCRAWLSDPDLPESLPRVYAHRFALPSERPADISEREWQVVTLRYVGGATLERIARHLGITRERTRQIDAKALRKHREWFVD